MALTYRTASVQDLGRLTEIYNAAILRGGCTCDMDVFTEAQRKKWLLEHNEKYPVLVFEQENRIVAYGSLSPYRPGRRAVEQVAEVSIYVDLDYIGKGTGSFVLETLIGEAKKRGLEFLLSIILESNQASTSLFRKFGFELWGRLPDIVKQNDLVTSHMYYGLNI